MKGTRPLDNDEIRSVSTCFTGTYEVRNRGLFLLGVSTGGRISELLSLTIGRYTNFQKSGAASALKTITAKMMFLELKRRGYDLSSLRDNPTTAEILKIS